MKSIAKHAAVGVLALAVVVLETVPAGGDPQPAQNEGCLGETFHVTIVSHVHEKFRINAAWQRDPNGSTKGTWDYDLTLRGTYVRELRNGKLRWVSRTVDWSGKQSNVLEGCYSDDFDAGGHLELGPTDGDVGTMTSKEQGKLKWNLRSKKTGPAICFLLGGGCGYPLKFPPILAFGNKLRSGCGDARGPSCRSYNNKDVDKCGTRYSETVEERGNEKVNVSADDDKITPEGKTKVHIKVSCEHLAIKGAYVEVTVKPVDESGGHYHVSKRLRGKLNGKDCGDLTNSKPCVIPKTDKDGEVTDSKNQKGLTFVPPGQTTSSRCVGLAGIYEVTAKSKDFPYLKDTVVITVKYDNLTSKLVDDTDSGSGITMKGGTILGSYYDVRSATNAHPLGTWGTPTTVSAFQSVAKEFYQLQLHHNAVLKQCGQPNGWPPMKVSFNDIALPGGGLFDLGPSATHPFHPWWQPGHQTHGKGEGGDFNHFYQTSWLKECNGTNVNFDAWLWSNLKAIGEKHGGVWDQYDLDNGNYWHLHMDDANVNAPSSCPNDN